MMNNLEELQNMNLESRKVFSYFEEISAIPHGSRNTKQISDYLVSFAKEHQLEYYQDDLNNVVIIQEATEGYENAEPIIIQGHMDMVCEKENDYQIDFENDGLSLYIDGDFLKAKGTTLGADDGIAVAYALAILDSPEISHPRLEIVITVDEEIGLIGAEAIDLSMLKAHKMLNIDSDLEGHFLTSCAGGISVLSKIPVSYIKQKGLSYQIKVTGLLGGHSGSEIDKEHANANILMGRLLKFISERMEIGIYGLWGGNKDNVITRESEALILIPSEKENCFLSYLNNLEEILKKEYAVSDPEIRILAVAKGEEESNILSCSAMTKVIFFLRNVPNGIFHMSSVIPGLVETSSNNGVLRLDNEYFSMTTSVRSSVSSRKAELVDRIELLAEFLGGEVYLRGDYPAWEFKTNSSLRETVNTVYKDLFQEDPIFEAIHAGLECGIISGKISDLDCVSFGPTNYDIHTPKERLSISSTERVWKLLLEILKRSK